MYFAQVTQACPALGTPPHDMTRRKLRFVREMFERTDGSPSLSAPWTDLNFFIRPRVWTRAEKLRVGTDVARFARVPSSAAVVVKVIP